MHDSESVSVTNVRTTASSKKPRFDAIFENGQTVSNGKICILISPEFRLDYERLRRFYDGAFDSRRRGTAVVGVFGQAGDIPSYRIKVKTSVTSYKKVVGVWLNPFPKLPVAMDVVVRRHRAEAMAEALSGRFFTQELESVCLENLDEFVVYYLSRFMWKPVLRALYYREGRATNTAAERYAISELARWRDL